MRCWFKEYDTVLCRISCSKWNICGQISIEFWQGKDGRRLGFALASHGSHHPNRIPSCWFFLIPNAHRGGIGEFYKRTIKYSPISLCEVFIPRRLRRKDICDDDRFTCPTADYPNETKKGSVCKASDPPFSM